MKQYQCFEHQTCEFFPCHKTDQLPLFNCLFCFCPLYHKQSCGGNFKLLANGTKDCSDCIIPHKPDCYGYIIDQLKQTDD